MQNDPGCEKLCNPRFISPFPIMLLTQIMEEGAPKNACRCADRYSQFSAHKSGNAGSMTKGR